MPSDSTGSRSPTWCQVKPTGKPTAIYPSSSGASSGHGARHWRAPQQTGLLFIIVYSPRG
ncbi:unnamed protein product [Prunus armeniaca]|uniref:Uncharacterized protein n=1 Tax=Prunus armeniaca TaxID=36596 RepID=A0A6J5TTN6_PRUAR|nr:unnamed protein product [Prunus armeniaca]